MTWAAMRALPRATLSLQRAGIVGPEWDGVCSFGGAQARRATSALLTRHCWRCALAASFNMRNMAIPTCFPLLAVCFRQPARVEQQRHDVVCVRRRRDAQPGLLSFTQTPHSRDGEPAPVQHAQNVVDTRHAGNRTTPGGDRKDNDRWGRPGQKNFPEKLAGRERLRVFGALRKAPERG